MIPTMAVPIHSMFRYQKRVNKQTPPSVEANLRPVEITNVSREEMNKMAELLRENFGHVPEDPSLVDEEDHAGQTASEAGHHWASNVTTTRSGRISCPPPRLIDEMEVAIALPWEVFHDGGYNIQDNMEDPIAFAASTNPNIMHVDETMRAQDSAQFLKAMAEEVQAHTENDHWQVIKRENLPPGAEVLPSVWAMRRRHHIATQDIYKWKARLNIHGGKQKNRSIIGRPTVQLLVGQP
jgi:hypothetical protein